MDADSDSTGEAPSIEVPWVNVINLEHPGVVQNVDKAIQSLGGESRLATFLNDPPQHQVISCKLRPEDSFRPGIPHSTVEVSDVVIRVELPRRTGRKRKRGSQDPFIDHQSPVTKAEDPSSSQYLLRSLRDCEGMYRTEAVGIVDESHRFRRLPDFQYSVMTSNMAKRLTRHILPFKYENIKHFPLDSTTHGIQADMDLMPPPSFAPLDLPFNYQYLDNPNSTLRREGSSGEASANRLPAQSQMQMLKYDALPDEIPQRAPPSIGPEESLPKHIADLVSKLRKVLLERPIVTRRVVLNLLSHKYNYDLRMASPYVSYMFRSGPYRDCYIRLGLDPRQNSAMCIYQALSFKVPTRAADEGRVKGKHTFHRSLKTTSNNPDSRIFDGKQLHTDGKVWQVADLTDVVMKRIFDAPLREECDTKLDGWYLNGTIAKARVIMKDKIDCIAKGELRSDDFYEVLLQLPDDLPDDYASGITRLEHGDEIASMATQVRGFARSTFRTRVTLSMIIAGASKEEGEDAEGESPSPMRDADDGSEEEEAEVAEDEERE